MSTKTPILEAQVTVVTVDDTGIFTFLANSGGEINFDYVKAPEYLPDTDDRLFTLAAGEVIEEYYGSVGQEITVILSRKAYNRWFAPKSPNAAQIISTQTISRTFSRKFDSYEAVIGFISYLRGSYPWGRELKYTVQGASFQAEVDYEARGEECGELIYSHLETDARVFNYTWNICMAANV